MYLPNLHKADNANTLITPPSRVARDSVLRWALCYCDPRNGLISAKSTVLPLYSVGDYKGITLQQVKVSIQGLKSANEWGGYGRYPYIKSTTYNVTYTISSMLQCYHCRTLKKEYFLSSLYKSIVSWMTS